jgi:UDP-glucose 4-epimerase
MPGLFEGKRILITGGTGSLGKTLIKTLLSGAHGKPSRIIVFSRDEAKQHDVRIAFRQLRAATEEVIFQDYEHLLQFQIGDVRDFDSVARAVRGADVIMNAAALKQVPSCEYFPYEAVQTNITGAENIVRAIETLGCPVETVIGVSTDKACKPVNVMGMSKAIQERVFVQANLRCPDTRFLCVRYGNVLATRGSVIPLFLSQIRAGGPVTLTVPTMTRFLLSLGRAVQTIVDAYRDARSGEIFVPRIHSSLISHVATALVGDRSIPIVETGIRPGEKLHEVLIAEDEGYRTTVRGDYYVIHPMLAELGGVPDGEPTLGGEWSSAHNVMDLAQTIAILRENHLMPDQLATRQEQGELLQ